MGDARLIVDDRWGGAHGIGRYASEVIPRLAHKYRALGGGPDPASPMDLLNPRRWVLRRSDVLYSPGFSAGVSRARQLLTIHDLIHLDVEPTRMKRGYYDGVVRPAVRGAGHVLTVSETSRSRIQEWLRDSAVQVHVTGNGASPAFCSGGDRRVSSRPYVLLVANFKPHKNSEVIFRALSLMPEHELVVVTPDQRKAQLLGNRHSITDRLVIKSKLTDQELAVLYRGAECLAFPSLVEGFGLPALEALRCGCPVVYYAGCRSVVEICAEGPSKVSAAEDEREWAKALTSPGPVTDGQRQALNRYSWDGVAEVVDRVTGEMLAGRVT